MGIFFNIIILFLGISVIYCLIKKRFKQALSSAVALALMYLPLALEMWLDIKIDVFGEALYIVVIFMTSYLGNAYRFYDKFSWWDRLAHFLSGVALVSFGIAAASNIGGLDKLETLFFSFLFATAFQTLWEVAEYAADCLIGSNNQRWQEKNSTNRLDIQDVGLLDTMNDTVICLAGTILACVAWWFVI